MAKRGRKAKPYAERVLNGNAGKRKMPDRDTAPLPAGREVSADDQQTEVASFGAPKPPRHLSKVAKEEWNRLATLMVARGLLRELDMMGFEVRCETYSRWRQAKAVISRRGKNGGLTYVNDGLVKKRPEVGIIAECERAIARFDSEYGLTPAGRARTTIATGEDAANKQPGLPFGQQPPAQKPSPTAATAQPVTPSDMDDDAFLAGPRARLN